MCSRMGLGAMMRRIVVMVVMALLLASGTAHSIRLVAAQSPGSIIGPQDVWLITRLQVTAADGSSIDILPQLLALADATPGGTADLGDGFSYTDAPALTAAALDVSGAAFDTIAVRVGVVRDANTEDHGVPLLAIVSSPDFSQQPLNLDATSRVTLDLGGVPEAANISGGTISYLFLQMLPPSDHAKESGLDAAAILAQRWQGGHYQVLGATGTNGVLQPGIVVDAPLTSAASAPSQVGYLASTGSASFGAFGDAGNIFDNQLTPETGRVAQRSVGAMNLGGAITTNWVDQLCGNPHSEFTYCDLRVQATGTFDTPELPVLGGHVHADITFTAQVQIDFTGTTISAKLDETYTPMGNAAGCSHRNIRSVPTPHIMENRFHDVNASFNVVFNYHQLVGLSIADIIDTTIDGTRVVGEGWQCEKAPGHIVEIGAPALNYFVLPDKIRLLNKDTLYGGPQSLIAVQVAIFGIGNSKSTVDSRIPLSVSTLTSSNSGTGHLDVIITFHREVLLGPQADPPFRRPLPPAP